MRPARMVTVVATCVTLVGCCAACTDSSTAEPDGDTPVPTVVAPTREPVPMAPPTPADDADPATWTVTAGGVGPVVLGDDLAGTAVHMRAFTRDDSGCSAGGVATWVREDGPTMRVLADAAGRIVGVAVIGDETAGALRTSPRTQSGQGVGSSIEDVERAFPALVEFDVGTGSGADARLDAWGVPVGDRWVTFQLDAAGDRVQTVWVGMTPTPPEGVCR